MRPDYTGAANAAALQAAIHAAQIDSGSGNPNGAIVLIPSFGVDSEGANVYGSYNIEATSSPAITIPEMGDNASPLLIMGTGPGTTLVMLTPGITLFSVNSAFTTFQDLTLVDASEDETMAGTAFDFGTGGGSKGYKLFRVSIVDFPKAIFVENQVLAVNILACAISYDTSYSGANCTAIKTSGAETNIEQCSLTFGASGSGTYTGIDIIASSYARVTDTQVSGFGTGIMIGGEGSNTARGAILTGLDVEAVVACVEINGPAYDVCFSSCSFAPSDSMLPGDYGLIVGTSGGENSSYDTIRFMACTVEGFHTYGLQILCGQNLQVNGGSYSGNGTAGIAIVGDVAEVQITGANCIGTAGSATQMYGIYITAGEDVQIMGVNCSGNGVAGIEINGATLTSVQDVRIVGAACENGVFGAILQQYGIYVENASGVLIDGCTLTGNTSYAVYLSTVENVTVSACDVYSSGAKGIFVGGPAAGPTTYVFIRGCNGAQYANYTLFLTVSGEVSDLEVTDCAGYNDLGNTILANTTIAPSGAFSGVTYGYYGPTAFYLAATSVSVTIDGQLTHLSSGGFTLAPGESADIAVSGGTVTHFLMVGK
jgi:parallel beta-helix repeat protein